MRASRLVAIVILLQTRGRTTADELARRLEVSVRTIYRDLESLGAAGVPVYGDRGPGGGFSLLDGYRTDLTGLGADEAEALLLIGLPGPAAALGLGPAAAAAEHKLLAALPGTRRAEADRIGTRFLLDPVPWYRAPDPTGHLPGIARAVLDQRRVTMTYDSWTATRRRHVRPLGLVLKGGDWYLVAHADGRARIFKVAAIRDPVVHDTTFERPPGFDLGAWWADALARFEADLRPDVATLRLSPRGLDLLARQGAHAADAARHAPPPGPDGWTTLRLPVERPEGALVGLLALGAEVEVLEPVALRERLHGLATAIARRHAPRRRARRAGTIPT